MAPAIDYLVNYMLISSLQLAALILVGLLPSSSCLQPVCKTLCCILTFSKDSI